MPPRRPAPSQTAVALAVLSAATWSLAGVWVRLLPGVPLVTVVAGRLALALAVVGPVALVRWRGLGRPGGAALGLAVLMTAYYAAAVAAFRLTPVAEGTLFVNASPLFAVAWAAARGEPVRRGERWGTALALAGVAVILVPGLVAEGGAGRARVAGDGLALCAAAGMAAYAVAYRRLGDRAPAPLLVTALTFALGAIGAAVWVGVRGGAALAGLDGPAPWGALVGLAVVTTAVPTFAYSVAAQRLPPILTTTVRLLTPVFALFAAWAVLGEVPSVWVVPGGALVLAGLALSVRAGAGRPPR